MSNSFSKKLTFSVSPLALLIASGTPEISRAQSVNSIDEIVVTARKKDETLQDVPVAVSALGEEALDQLGVDTFEDYLTQLPSVTAGGSGPGQNTIYIRGLASTTPNLTTAGVAGLAPNVSFYLDEQPLAQPGRNLDVYAADIERIEVLSGPQGTLFGSSSQAGVVRMITNKPNFDGYSAEITVQGTYMSEGDPGSKIEGMVNFPISDKTAIRVVGYYDKKGGFIDNIAGTRSAEQSARFRPVGTVRNNGVPVSTGRAGFQSGADLSNVNFTVANNDAQVEDNFNESSYAGFRASLKHLINDDWSALLSVSSQTIDSDGVFFADPSLGDLKVQRFNDESSEDEFTNVNLTLEGRIGNLEVIYAGAYTDREAEQTIDYTDYLFVGQYLPYYICDGTVSYPATGDLPTGNCYSPSMFVNAKTETTVETHELRFNTISDGPLSATFGAFMSELELKELNDFVYPGHVNVVSASGVGFPPNYPLTNTAVTGVVGNAAPGYFSDPGPFPAGTVFRNDVLRTDEQLGLFGEVNYEVVPNTVEVTLGARYYDTEVDLEGSANSSFGNLGAAEDAQLYGTNISALYGPNRPAGNPDTAAADGTIYKATVQYTPEDDIMYYLTYSEGFRAGLLNRPGGASGPNGYTVPYAVDTDEVKNYEFGWKTLLLDGSLRLNGSIFFVEVDGLQTTIFDTSIVNLFFSDNAANAEIKGFEADFIYLTGIDGLTMAGAVSFLDTEITEKITPTNDVVVGDELAFAPGYQGNLRVRYEWDMGDGYVGHVMPQVTVSDKSYSDIITINRDEIDGWAKLDLRVGVTGEEWSSEFFIENLTDERAEISRDFVYDTNRVTFMRPMTIGLKVNRKF
ncbi:MAG: TonB-dependent receptor [Candidatus Micropelagos thuwalensis]